MLTAKVFAGENLRVVHPNAIQFVLSRLNPSFAELFKLNLEKRENFLNEAVGKITTSSGKAWGDKLLQVYYYTFAYSDDSNKTYSIKCFKLENEGFNAHIAINQDADGLELYKDLLVLFNVLEFIRPILNDENVGYSDFETLFLKGCYQFECQMSSFYVTENGLKWLESIDKVDTRFYYKKRVDVGCGKWLELYSKGYKNTGVQIWNQIFSDHNIVPDKP
jgi:hypothetical protein